MEFNEVYNTHKELVYNIVRKILKRELDVINDLCQDIWILIFKKLHQYDEKKGIIEGWIYRIASNQVFKYFKKQELEKNTISINNFDYNFPCSPDAFKNEDQKEQRQKIELIKRKSSKLKRSSKDVFQLYYFEGMIHEEIAEIKGLSWNTSKSQLMRARARIKELIK